MYRLILNYWFLFFVVVLLSACDNDVQEEIPTTSSNVEGHSIYIQNFTGHLVRRSGVKCGPGITVVFELSTRNNKREFTLQGDTYRTGYMPVERGELITVKAYELVDGSEYLLTQKSVVFDPEPDQAWEPNIILCPKDVLTFYDF